MITIQNLSKTYHHKSTSTHVLDRISFSARKGETIAIVGPSGAGKTTLLNCIAGLDSDFTGSIQIHKEEAPMYFKYTRVAMISQSYTNFPWMTVQKNIAEAAQTPPVLQDVGMLEFQNFYPDQLSGGMQQRVAIARALIQDADITVCDEPFGALDASTRERLQILFKKVFLQKNKTVIFVTHDIEEALFVADRIFVLSPRPSRILKEYKNNFKKILDPEIKLEPHFIALRKKIHHDITSQ